MGHPLLVDKTADGNHGQAAVNQLGVLELVKGGIGLGQVQRVEPELPGPAAAALHHLENGGHANNNLQPTNPQQQLLHGALRNEVVVGWLRQRGAARVEGKRVKLLDKQAQDGQHGDAAVLDLRLPQELKINIVAEAQRVKAHICTVQEHDQNNTEKRQQNTQEVRRALAATPHYMHR